MKESSVKKASFNERRRKNCKKKGRMYLLKLPFVHFDIEID